MLVSKEQENSIATSEPTTRQSTTEQETTITATQPTTTAGATEQETNVRSTSEQKRTSQSGTEQETTTLTSSATDKTKTYLTKFSSEPDSLTKLSSNQVATPQQERMTSQSSSVVEITTKDATSEVTTNRNVKSSESQAPAKPSTTDRDKAVSYVGPIVMGCSVVIFILVAIIVFVYWKIKTTKSQKGNTDEIDSVDSSYQVKRWSIYTGQPGSFLKKTPENSMNFRCAVRLNTSEREDVFSQIKQESWTTA